LKLRERVGTSVEICAGAGGQALGLERAGFRHLALIENDPHACQTLRLNRPAWNVIEDDVWNFIKTDSAKYRGIDLLAGGVPCPPFSMAGKQLGADDDRDLFPAALALVETCAPNAVMLENVRGILAPKFEAYRHHILAQLSDLGFTGEWRLLNASEFGVPQLRPRAVLVAMRHEFWGSFEWPRPLRTPPPSVGQKLYRLMGSRGWVGANEWKRRANRIAPTLVGGSKKHGGPDLGPTRAKREWAALGVNALVLADEPPPPGFKGSPSLTVPMTAVLQGFPRTWKLAGRKTAAYRQVGNAFPPPVAEAVGTAIACALEMATRANSRGVA
jgi:DNA (cytosine-5)-methyltransferase 1